MSALTDLTAAGDSSTLPGLLLSPPRLLEWAEAEQEAQRQYLSSIAATDLPTAARDAMYARAIDNLRDAPFSFGSPQFDAWATSASALPMLLWLSLRIKQPQITRSAAAELLIHHDNAQIIAAVLNLWGYRAEKKTPPRDGTEVGAVVADSPASESTGPRSSAG